MKRTTTILLSLFAASFVRMASAAALPTEITVQLVMTHDVYVAGERVRAVVDVANASADVIDCRKQDAADRLFVEVFRAHDQHRYERISSKPFVAPFALLSGEGQKLETFLADHFRFDENTRYLARAVLVHGGMRFESSLKSFDMVPGLPCGNALQMFSNRDGLQRHFELVHWGRDKVEHLFMKARDDGISTRRWRTTDLGPVLRVKPPIVSVMPSGEVVVLHLATQGKYLYSTFWSLPDILEFRGREVMADPDVAGAERVKEFYKDTGGVEPVKKAWWKFW